MDFCPITEQADHILTLKTLIDKNVTQKSNKKIYACFVDFKKAFDSVWHDGMLFKLLNNKIGRKFYDLLKSLYSNSQCAVKQSQCRTSFFPYSKGVRQGCILSPLLFNLYLNDLPQLISDSTSDPLLLSNNTKLNCLLYADDLVLLSSSPQGLQNCLNQLNSWCERWLMQINLKKTKVMIFQKSNKKQQRPDFFIGDKTIQITQEYHYLGLNLSSNGLFTQAIKTLTAKGIQTLFSIKKKINFSNLKPKLAIKIFDSIISPILLYNSEVWGGYTCTNKDFHKWNQTPTEKAHLKFCKLYLGLHRKATNIACRGELGKFPLLINIHKRLFKYLIHINSLPDSTFVKQAFQLSKELHSSKKQGFYSNVIKIFKSFNESFEADNLESLTHNSMNQHVTNMKNKYSLFWKHKLTNSPKIRFLSSIKSEFKLEQYLDHINNPSHRKQLTQFRVSCHSLHIESGRYNKTSREQRLCENCDFNEIEDECHFSLKCKYYERQRKDLISILQNKTNMMIRFETFNDLLQILSSNDSEIINIFSRYLFACFKKRNECLDTRVTQNNKISTKV